MCARRQARKNQANPQKCPFNCKRYCSSEEEKPHTPATPELLLFFSPPRALLTRGEAIQQAFPSFSKCDCFHHHHLSRPAWLPACSRQDPKPGKADSTLRTSCSIQVFRTHSLSTVAIHNNIRRLSCKSTFISTDWTTPTSTNCP